MGADPRFFPARGPIRLAAIAEAVGARLATGEDREISGVAPLALATAGDLAYLEGRRHIEALRATRAGAVLLGEDFAATAPDGCAVLVTATPQLAFARAAALFHPRPAPVPGIHPTASVAVDATVAEGCEVGPFAVIGAGAEIGPGCIIGAHAVVGAGCVLGAGSILRAHATMEHCLAGEGVVLHQGARIGNEGFGFVTTAAGEHVTVPQIGRVILGDGVEIGANSCVDRGAGGDTVLGPGTRLDNLVQVGHNVRTGRGCVLVAQVGISGSTRLGDYVTLAGQAGATGHITIGDGARVGAQAGVMRDVAAGEDVVGSPAMPARDWMRQVMVLKRLAERSRGGKGGSE
ncbi:MAG: UDP-3-O-(3-hydroxymyristoyl)glucosamine N-acyltransferase [Rubritepida sp.]|nr:UDP-3-O-(3-hydroxymyristoyl)glucosamine N-acyltransferase [Rubritepida sp.]